MLLLYRLKLKLLFKLAPNNVCVRITHMLQIMQSSVVKQSSDVLVFVIKGMKLSSHSLLYECGRTHAETGDTAL